MFFLVLLMSWKPILKYLMLNTQQRGSHLLSGKETVREKKMETGCAGCMTEKQLSKFTFSPPNRVELWLVFPYTSMQWWETGEE